ncbi:MAG: PKD domain-containing protein, partial [bacterium]
MKSRKEMKQHALLLSIFVFSCVLIYTAGCESKKDPFSAKNQAPVIADFSFQPDPKMQDIGADSLKFRSGESYKLRLEYNDAEFASSETQKLQAVFQFINGSGAFSHDKFEPDGSDGQRFKVPPSFNDDVLFLPDTSGLVRIELTLSDGVKSNDPPARTSAIFFDNLAPVPVFTARALNQVNPYRFEFNPSASTDRDGTIEKLIWDFGDGSEISTEENPEHT